MPFLPRAALNVSEKLRNDVGQQPVLDQRDPILELELALLQAADGEGIPGPDGEEGGDGAVEVAVLLLQASEKLAEVALFLICHRGELEEPFPAGAKGEKIERLPGLDAVRDRPSTARPGRATIAVPSDEEKEVESG